MHEERGRLNGGGDGLRHAWFLVHDRFSQRMVLAIRPNVGIKTSDYFPTNKFDASIEREKILCLNIIRGWFQSDCRLHGEAKRAFPEVHRLTLGFNTLVYFADSSSRQCVESLPNRQVRRAAGVSIWSVLWFRLRNSQDDAPLV